MASLFAVCQNTRIRGVSKQFSYVGQNTDRYVSGEMFHQHTIIDIIDSLISKLHMNKEQKGFGL